MSFNHKADCKFKDFRASMIRFDDNGPDSQLEIDENGICFDHNIHTNDADLDYSVVFEFCPCCGGVREY